MTDNTSEPEQINEYDNLIDLAMTQKPGEFADQFVNLMRSRIAGKVDAIKTDMKQFLFARPEQRDVDADAEIDVVTNSVPPVAFSKDEVEEEALGKEEMPAHGDVADEIEAATKEKNHPPEPKSRWWTPRQAQLAKELGIKEDTQLDEKNWIAGATKNKGGLHRKLGVPEGKKIPASKLASAANSDDPTERKEANLAKTLKGLRK